MKTAVSKRLFIIALALALVMGMGLLAAPRVSAESEAVTIYASNLTDDAQLGLSDDTVLVMDVDRRLSAIIGEDCDLTIVGDKTLTVASENKVAIDVRSLTSEANLIATSPTEYYVGSTINVTRDFCFTGESLWVGGANGIRSDSGDIEIYGRTTILCSQGAALHTEAGHITVDAPYIKCTVDESDAYSASYSAVESSGEVSISTDEGIFIGVDAGIHAGAMVTLAGNISCEGNDYGIYSEYGRVSFEGDKLYAYGEIGIFTNYDVIITATNGGVGGDVNAIQTTEGNIELNGTNYVASDGDALYAVAGNITLSGTNNITSYGEGAIYADLGTITMTGAVTAQGGEDYYAIAASGDISFDGTKLDVKGHAGILTYEGNVTLNGTNVSVAADGSVGIVAYEGGVCIDSDYLFVQGTYQTDEVIWGNGISAVSDVSITSEDATISGRHGIRSGSGNVILNGNVSVSGHMCAVVVEKGTITMTGAVTAQGGDGYFAIAATGDITFDGTKLDVKGSSGVRSAEGNVTIDAANVSVVGDDGVGVIAHAGSISIDSDYLFVQCAAQDGDTYWQHGIGATKDVMIVSDDATIAGIYGVYSETGNITLSGNITVGAQVNAIRASKGTITMLGAITAHSPDENDPVICAAGDISFNGTTLNVAGGYGINTTEGNISIIADSTTVITETGAPIQAFVYTFGDYIGAEGGSVYIDSDYLYLQNKMEAEDHPLAQWDGIMAGTNVTVYSQNATIVGKYGISAVGDIKLYGEVDIAGGLKSAVWSDEGDITLDGNITARAPSADGYAIRAYKGSIIIADGSLDATAGGDYALYAENGIEMDPALSIMLPEAGRMEANTIVDANGDPADQVLIGTIISDISVNVNTPVAGKEPIRYFGQVYNMPLGSSVRAIRWYKNGELWDVSSGNARFEAGNTYQLEINLVTRNGFYFADPLTSAAINYQTAEVSTPSGLPAYEIVLSLDFGECPAVVYNVDLTIDTPRENYFPDQSVTCGSSIYEQALVGDNMFDTPLQWQKSEDGTTWTTMDLNETFTVGYYYRVYIDLMPANGYQFAIDPQIEPDVSAKVNGFRAEVSRYPEEDPEKLISVCYNFGLMNHSIIQQIDIDGVTEPVVGDHPSYDCAISGTGYSINTACDNGTYVVNGICWRDMTDDKWMYPSDTFEIGHEYRVFVDVKTEDGYEFDTEQVGNSYVPNGWGYINDNYATLGIQDDGRFEQSLSWTFTCERKTMKSVEVGGLDVPVQGATPDYDAVADHAYYTVDSVTWFDYTTGLDMTDTDTFVDGHEYWVLVTVVPNEIEGSKLCRFVPDKTAAMLNGIEVRKDKNKHWQEVESSINFVRIYYTYICGEEEPIVIRVQPANRSVTGGQTAKFSVTAIGDGLTYQWEYRPDANTAWSDSEASGNKTATLSISGAKHRNGFEYRCKITDAHGNVRYTEAAKLTVTTSIVVTQQPVSVTVAAGEKATVTVDASGDNLSYAWYYRDGSTGKFKLTTSFTGNSYSVTMNASRSGRQVYCVITDANGFSAQTATVTLGMKATIITQPKSASVKSKETITVSLEAAGDGLTYTWYYSDDGGLSFKKTTSFTGNSYSITMTSARAGRKVYCVVTDKFGNSVTSKTVTLGMRGTAAIRTQPVSVTVASGETAKVAVRASGTGLTYEWYFSDNGGLSFSKTTAFTGNSYSIKMNASRAGRQVYCVVTDKNGNSVKSEVVTLGMTGKAAIRTQPVSVTVANGETAMVAVRASGTGLTYTWFYSDDGGKTFKVTTAFTGSTYSVPMGAKRAGRQVYCVVTDKNGNSVQTDTVTLGMTGKATIHTQPVGVTVANGETAMVAVRASGTGLTYEWYYSDNGGKKYYKTTAFTGSSYYVPMNASRDGRMLYCVITDANGNKVTTDVVILNMG